jgi:hypothetical protein
LFVLDSDKLLPMIQKLLQIFLEPFFDTCVGAVAGFAVRQVVDD